MSLRDCRGGSAWELADYLAKIDILSHDKSATDYYRRRVIKLVTAFRADPIPELLIERLTPELHADFNTAY